jgi:hypothetical protein
VYVSVAMSLKPGGILVNVADAKLKNTALSGLSALVRKKSSVLAFSAWIILAVSQRGV